jgi:hypothetical protein
MNLSNDFKLSTSGEGYLEVLTGEERVYVHRLSAVAEHGFDAVKDMDVHHEEGKWINNSGSLSPEDPEEHRKLTLDNVESKVKA